MFILSCNLLSISKQRGAAISSKLIPPKLGSSLAIVSTNSSVSCVFNANGIASTFPSALNNTHFPSITGIEASAPIFPNPKTAEPSVMTATKWLLAV